MSRIFDKIQSNIIYLDNDNSVYIYNDNGQLAATGPSGGAIIPNFFGPTGIQGPTGLQGPVQLYNVESITGTQIVDPNIRITMIKEGQIHTLMTTGGTGGTLKYIVDDILRDNTTYNFIISIMYYRVYHF